MTFESLEDNFMKNIKEPVKTDAQQAFEQKKQASEQSADKETYEDKLNKKAVIGGLAALFQEKVKSLRKEENAEESDSTVFISTENVKYGDQFQDATNYVSEEDIQQFLPGDVYNDSIKEPDLNEGKVEFDQRHTPGNKYAENLEFEPSIASESDISPQSSISRSIDADNPQEDEHIMEKVAEHRAKKRAFQENTWKPGNEYNVGPQISDSQVQNKDNESTTFQETELSKEEHEKHIQEIQSSVVKNTHSDIDE
tara:strand:- start:42 stop:803 length:762 start_codon:yes stop_codon:yes gene_type:complete